MTCCYLNGCFTFGCLWLSQALAELLNMSSQLLGLLVVLLALQPGMERD